MKECGEGVDEGSRSRGRMVRDDSESGEEE